MTNTIPAVEYPDIGKKQYMERFEPFFSPRQMRYLRAAYAFSKEGHRSQTRDDGRRYFDHVRACSWIAIDELRLHDFELHVALLLHDIVEDTYLLTTESIEMFFGEEVAIMVNLLTHRPGIPVADYVRNLTESRRNLVIMAKLIDRLHNLRTLGGCPTDKRGRKAEETRQYYLPLADCLVNADLSHRPQAEKVREEILALTNPWSAPSSEATL